MGIEIAKPEIEGLEPGQVFITTERVFGRTEVAGEIEVGEGVLVQFVETKEFIPEEPYLQGEDNLWHKFEEKNTPGNFTSRGGRCFYIQHKQLGNLTLMSEQEVLAMHQLHALVRTQRFIGINRRNSGETHEYIKYLIEQVNAGETLTEEQLNELLVKIIEQQTALQFAREQLEKLKNQQTNT